MKLNIDNFIPFLVIGAFIFLFAFNNKTPVATEHGNVIIPPKKELAILRTTAQADTEENDNKVVIKHIASGDKLDFRLWQDYIALPDNVKKLPTKTTADGKEEPIWEIKHIRRDWLFDPGIYIGTYSGYLTGPVEGTNVKHFDVGIKFSPLMIYNTVSPDVLISNQGLGVGISFHPSEERFGRFARHLDIGYARFYTLDDDCQRNLFYLGISTRF